MASRCDIMKLAVKETVNTAANYIVIALLAVLMALNYQLFVVENDFAPAGLNGIATMIQYKTGFSIGYVSLIINIPLCIFAYFFVNRKFAVSTLIYCLVYSFSFLYIQKLGLQQFQYDANGHNTVFPVILSGTVSGFIYGVCAGKNASTGGTDIISKYISQTKLRINFFWATFVLNAAVAVVSFFVYAKTGENGEIIYDYNPVCLCILYCFLSSFLGDFVVKGTKTAMRFTVITESPKEIAQDIARELRHGSTQIEAIGSYYGDAKTILICVINKHQLLDLKKILSRYENTFAFSESVNETYGNFKKIR